MQPTPRIAEFETAAGSQGHCLGELPGAQPADDHQSNLASGLAVQMMARAWVRE
ncbi:MAG: hypothetical protein P8M79_01275 [Alphaproteobacteria bacterium]|nr:hypothetical protein [Alphaproteobacteria bacterium]